MRKMSYFEARLQAFDEELTRVKGLSDDLSKAEAHEAEASALTSMLDSLHSERQLSSGEEHQAIDETRGLDTSHPLFRYENAYVSWIGRGWHVWSTAPGRPHPKILSPEYQATKQLGPKSWQGKPVQGALFTSAAYRGTGGAWRQYLQDNESLFGPISSSWQVRGNGVIRELTVRTSGDWVALLEVVGVADSEGEVNADWLAASHLFDVIHLTPLAVVAVDGMSFRTSRGNSARTAWGMPTSVWLTANYRAERLLG